MSTDIVTINRFFDRKGARITLAEKKLRFTRMDSLNDPLDGSELLFAEALKQHAINDTLEKLSGNSINKRRKLKSKMQIEQNKHGNKVYDRILNEFQKKNFVCSFSKHYDGDESYLLWSYYADNHKGIVIEFYSESFCFHLVEVNYPENLKAVSPDFFRSTQLDIKKLIGNKKKLWEHEDEVRYLARPMALDEKNIRWEPDGDNQEYLKISLPPNSIKKVIFGCKTESACKSQIIEIIKGYEYRIEVEEMYIDKESLNLRSRKYFDEQKRGVAP